MPGRGALIYGAGMNAAAQHSQSFYNLLTAVPGLKVVLPTTPADAKGLLTEALRGDDPVMFFEHKALYGRKGEVPEGDHRVPFGHARMVREGGDVTIVACGRMVNFAEKAADGWPPMASAATSSTCAPPARWMKKRSSIRSNRPGGWSWLMKVRRAAPGCRHRRHRR
jgi:hypothetical protein